MKHFIASLFLAIDPAIAFYIIPKLSPDCKLFPSGFWR